MFWLFGKKRVERLERDIEKSFLTVKNDFEKVGKWIKHLDGHKRGLSKSVEEIKLELATIREELETIKETISLVNFAAEGKQLSKKQTAVGKQTAVYAVQEPVQTAVQTANFYDFLQGLSANERLIVFTLLNADEGMKLSYEDIARLLGKERSTIRGQINAIKQKSEGLLFELTEPNGKKRVYIPEEIKEKLTKYAKVRVKGAGKRNKK